MIASIAAAAAAQAGACGRRPAVREGRQIVIFPEARGGAGTAAAQPGIAALATQTRLQRSRWRPTQQYWGPPGCRSGTIHIRVLGDPDRDRAQLMQRLKRRCG
jgi:hypothetical protein